MKGTLLNIGGKDRYLRYDANAWAAIGERLGVKIRLGHFQEDLMATELPLSAPRTIVWAGLLHAEPELTEQEVGSWIDEENWREVLEAFFSRFGGTSPQVQETLRSVMGEPQAQTEPVAQAS